jgi:hypothetical protein
MSHHIIYQTDTEGTEYQWIGIDEETARLLYEKNESLFYVREDAEGLIEDDEDLESAIEHDSVSIGESYLWREEYEEGAQNRARNNDFTSFEEWVEKKIESYL